MAVLGANRLAMPRAEFEAWAATKDKSTQARYIRAYNEHQRKEPYGLNAPSRSQQRAAPKRAGGEPYKVVYKITGKAHGEKKTIFVSRKQSDPYTTKEDRDEVRKNAQLYDMSKTRVVPVAVIDRARGKYIGRESRQQKLKTS